MRLALLILLGLLLCLSLAGLALPERARIERSSVIAASPEQLHARLADFRRWPSWHPMFQDADKTHLAYEFGETASGVGGQLKLEFGTRFQVLFRTVVADPVHGVEIETHSGPQTLDLWRGEGALSLESVRFEPAPGGTRVTWVQTGAKASLLLQRTLEHLLVRRRIGKQIDQALEGLAADVAGASADG